MASHKNIILLSLFCFLFLEISAQVGIGTTTPKPSSALDVESSNSGVLMPRVVLTSTLVALPITSPETSLLVYNTNTTNGLNGVTPGYYFWNVNKWSRINEKIDKVFGEIYKDASEPAQPLSNTLPVNFGSNGIITPGVTATLNYLQVSIPGIYKISYAISFRKATDPQSTMGFYLATGYVPGTPPAITGIIPASFCYPNLELYAGYPGSNSCRNSKLVHLNSGQRIYLFTDTTDSNIIILPDTVTMNIELIKAD